MDDQAGPEKKRFVILMVDEGENDWAPVMQAFAEEEHHLEIDACRVESGVELPGYLDRCKNTEAAGCSVPDLILLDLNMPRSSGRETLKHAVCHRSSRHVPIMALTTSADKIDEIECYRCGGTMFSQKPYDYETLRKLVRIIVEHWLGATHLPRYAPFECMGYG